jgi:hypothetical protein
MKGTDMRFRIFTSIFLFYALTGSAKAIDKLYFYMECAPGQKCIPLAYENGKTELAGETPALILEKADIRSARLTLIEHLAQQALDVEFEKEAAKKLGNITRENIGKKLMMVFHNKILTAPVIHTPSGDGIMITSEEITRIADRFWEFLDYNMLYLYAPCTAGQKCKDLAYENGKTESVMATPVLMLAKTDIRSAILQWKNNYQPPQQILDIDFEKEAAKRIEKIVRENIGRNVIVSFDNKILSWLNMDSVIIFGKIRIMTPEDQTRYCQKVPWLGDFIKASYKANSHSIIISAIIYLTITVAVLIAAFTYVFWPRRDQRPDSDPELSGT